MIQNGKNQDDLLKLNRSLVLRLIGRLRECSRAELARRTGLTKATITGITQQLLRAGIIRETRLLQGPGGHRAIGLALEKEKYLCVGLRLTRRQISAGLFDGAGESYGATERKIPAGAAPRDALALMADAVSCLLPAAAGRRVLGIGIASPGPILVREGKIAYMSAFPGWESLSIPQELEKRFGLPVRLEHDGVCCALSEWGELPPEAECHLMLCVMAGQGIGAGILLEGRPLRGALGCAGEIGHMSMDLHGPRCECGNYGCLEGYVSVLALEREMAKALESAPDHPLFGKKPGGAEILALAGAGDALAAALVRRQGEYLGMGVANLVNLLNPDWIVITDELAACDAIVDQAVRDTLAERVSPRILAGAHLAVRPGRPDQLLRAAAFLVIDQLINQPDLFMEAQSL